MASITEAYKTLNGDFKQVQPKKHNDNLMTRRSNFILDCPECVKENKESIKCKGYGQSYIPKMGDCNKHFNSP